MHICAEFIGKQPGFFNPGKQSKIVSEPSARKRQPGIKGNFARKKYFI